MPGYRIPRVGVSELCTCQWKYAALHAAQYGVWYHVARHVWFYKSSSIVYSGVCTEVGIARDPLWELKQASGLWSAMIRDTVRYGGNDKNSSGRMSSPGLVGIKSSSS